VAEANHLKLYQAIELAYLLLRRNNLLEAASLRHTKNSK